MKPIHIAAKNGFTEIVEYIVDQSPNKEDCLNFVGSESRSTSLLMTAVKGQFETCKLLLEKGSDIKIQNFYGDSIFHIAIRYK